MIPAHSSQRSWVRSAASALPVADPHQGDRGDDRPEGEHLRRRAAAPRPRPSVTGRWHELGRADRARRRRRRRRPARAAASTGSAKDASQHRRRRPGASGPAAGGRSGRAAAGRRAPRAGRAPKRATNQKASVGAREVVRVGRRRPTPYRAPSTVHTTATAPSSRPDACRPAGRAARTTAAAASSSPGSAGGGAEPGRRRPPARHRWSSRRARPSHQAASAIDQRRRDRQPAHGARGVGRRRAHASSITARVSRRPGTAVPRRRDRTTGPATGPRSLTGRVVGTASVPACRRPRPAPTIIEQESRP